MIRRLKLIISAPLALLFIFQVFLSSPAFAGLNLCISDGHVEIEAGNEDCCPPLAEAGSGSSYSQKDPTCDSCIDVSLGDLNLGPQVLSKVQTPGQYFAPRILEFTLHPLKPESVPRGPGFPSAANSTSVIQTVVLRV